MGHQHGTLAQTSTDPVLHGTTSLTISRVRTFRARQLQSSVVVTQRATVTTSVTALRSFIAHSRQQVQQWLAPLMPAATTSLNPRALMVANLLVAPSMRTMRATRPLSGRQRGSLRSKGKACHCEGLSQLCLLLYLNMFSACH